MDSKWSECTGRVPAKITLVVDGFGPIRRRRGRGDYLRQFSDHPSYEFLFAGVRAGAGRQQAGEPGGGPPPHQWFWHGEVGLQSGEQRAVSDKSCRHQSGCCGLRVLFAVQTGQEMGDGAGAFFGEPGEEIGSADAYFRVWSSSSVYRRCSSVRTAS
ncbi:hypothetical protein AMK12_37000 [Streptomyces sp. TSRI0395]|nr:hypothetical protein AMK12_37000 [Streptomyces sp. TSRI0395]